LALRTGFEPVEILRPHQISVRFEFDSSFTQFKFRPE